MHYFYGEEGGKWLVEKRERKEKGKGEDGKGEQGKKKKRGKENVG